MRLRGVIVQHEILIVIGIDRRRPASDLEPRQRPRLARQLHRTEDKLERVLQEVEALRDEVAARDATAASAGEGSNGTGAGARRAPNARAARAGTRKR